MGFNSGFKGLTYRLLKFERAFVAVFSIMLDCSVLFFFTVTFRYVINLDASKNHCAAGYLFHEHGSLYTLSCTYSNILRYSRITSTKSPSFCVDNLQREFHKTFGPRTSDA